jgi:hypothetical protein
MRNLFSFELLELALNICHRNGLVGVIIEVIPFAILELDVKLLPFLSRRYKSAAAFPFYRFESSAIKRDYLLQVLFSAEISGKAHLKPSFFDIIGNSTAIFNTDITFAST